MGRMVGLEDSQKEAGREEGAGQTEEVRRKVTV